MNQPYDGWVVDGVHFYLTQQLDRDNQPLPNQQPVRYVSLPASPNAMRAAALELYNGPFSYQSGYIFDKASHMVADQGDAEKSVEGAVAVRIRGWGRISYMPYAAQLQDEAGQVVADALTQYWQGSLKLRKVGYLHRGEVHKRKQMTSDGREFAPGQEVAYVFDGGPAPIAATVEELAELVEAAEEVLRISDRKHDAWDRLKAAIAVVEGRDVSG